MNNDPGADGIGGIVQRDIARTGLDKPGGQGDLAIYNGVASTSEAAAIMVYHEKTKYNEWEFVYDVNKARGAAAPPPAPAQPAAATTQQQPQQTPPVTTPTPVTPVTPATPSQ